MPDVLAANDYLEGRVSVPGGLAFPELCQRLAADSGNCEQRGSVIESLKACGQAGVYRWFLPPEYGGWGWSDREILQGYLRLSAACLATTFVITQRVAATKRILACDNHELQQELLPQLATQDRMVSVGISHLTTSGQHLTTPLLQAIAQPDGGWVLRGRVPWISGGVWCDTLVVGATLTDQTQLLVAVPTQSQGVVVEPAEDLVALGASQTGAVRFEDVRVSPQWILAGPVPEVLQRLTVGTTGGLQTSALALGLASTAIQYIMSESRQRQLLEDNAEQLQEQHTELCQQLLNDSERPDCDANPLRAAANRLTLRATQAALVVAKGAGFVTGHPCGRWCREALFFLVWSCPPSVQQTHLCEFSFSSPDFGK